MERGHLPTIPCSANINPAKESIENAIKFASNIKKILENENKIKINFLNCDFINFNCKY